MSCLLNGAGPDAERQQGGFGLHNAVAVDGVASGRTFVLRGRIQRVANLLIAQRWIATPDQRRDGRDESRPEYSPRCP